MYMYWLFVCLHQRQVVHVPLRAFPIVKRCFRGLGLQACHCVHAIYNQGHTVVLISYSTIVPRRCRYASINCSVEFSQPHSYNGKLEFSRIAAAVEKKFVDGCYVVVLTAVFKGIALRHCARVPHAHGISVSGLAF